jgi:hypothetical protein
MKLILIILIIIVSGCSESIHFDKLIDFQKPIKLSIDNSDVNKVFKIDTFIIMPSTEKYSKIINWLELRTDGWKTSPVSYVKSKFTLSQDNVSLLVYDNGLILSYMNKKGQMNQLSNNIKTDELVKLTK